MQREPPVKKNKRDLKFMPRFLGRARHSGSGGDAGKRGGVLVWHNLPASAEPETEFPPMFYDFCYTDF